MSASFFFSKYEVNRRFPARARRPLDICRGFRTVKGVQLPFSFFLALRFLQPKRTFVSVITVISVLGVTLGIAVLILVISVMTGFDLELRRKVLGFDPHIVVTGAGGPLAEWRVIPPKLAEFKGLTHSSPFVQGPVLLASGLGDVRSAQIRGVDPAAEGARDRRAPQGWGGWPSPRAISTAEVTPP